MSYTPGSTITHTFTFLDENGNVYDPSTVTGSIQGTTGATYVSLSLSNFTRVSTGVYTLSYTLPSNAALGTWSINLTATNAGNNNQTTIGGCYFLVVPTNPNPRILVT